MRPNPPQCKTLRASNSIFVKGLQCSEFTFSTPGAFPCKIHYRAHLFSKALGEGALMLAFGNTSDLVAFDFGFVSFSGFRVRKSCSFIFHVAVFLSRLLKEAGLMESCC